MKILFTVDSYYPRTSGVPVVVGYLAEGLAKKGHEVHVATRFVEGSPEIEFHNGVKIHRFCIIYNRLKKCVGKTQEYIDFVLTGKFDVIIFECVECVTTDILLPHLKELKCKKILHSHGFSGLSLIPWTWRFNLYKTIGNTVNYYIWHHYYFKGLYKKYGADFDNTLTLSEVDKDYSFLQEEMNIKPIVLSNAAEDMFFDEVLKSENSLKKYVVLKNENYLISVANYTEIKNQIGILKEFYKNPETKNFSMVFIGSCETPYYNKLLKTHSELEKNKDHRDVHFLKGVSRNDIPQILAHAKLYLCGSHWEAFSISLIEAMALAVPFISTDVGNARVLPGGRTIASINDMYLMIGNLLTHEEERKALAMKGKGYAFEYCRRSMAINHLEMILGGN